MLALVLVQALYLYVKQGAGVHHVALGLFQVLGQALLVALLDFLELLQHRGIVLILQQALELVGVVDIVLADQIGNQPGQLGVGLVQPPPVGDAVCHVGKLLGLLLVEVVEHVVLEDFAVQGGDAVDVVGADHGQVGHFHIAVVEGRHAVDFGLVHAFLAHLVPEAAVDFLYNLVDAGQAHFEQVPVPSLQGLAHHGVVGVGHRALDDVPGSVPAIAALVQHHPHHLGDGQHGVGVVEVDSRQLGQLIQVAVGVQVAADDVLDGGAHQEVLLGEPQQLAVGVVVLGVEHLGDNLAHGLLLHGAHVVAAVEELHVELVVFRLPHPQQADALAVHAGDAHVIGDGGDGGVILVPHGVVLVVPLLLDMAAKADFHGAFGHLLQPDAAAGQPGVGQLGLPAE